MSQYNRYHPHIAYIGYMHSQLDGETIKLIVTAIHQDFLSHSNEGEGLFHTDQTFCEQHWDIL